MRAADLALVLVALFAMPATASAQIQCTIGAFGHHEAAANLVIEPVGGDECDVAIPIAITGLMASGTQRYVDLWRATSRLAGCELGTVRGNTVTTVCEHLDLDVGATAFVTPTHVLEVTPRQLFGACDSSETRTFYVFDTVVMDDNTTTFAPDQYCVIDVAFDGDPPGAPTLADAPPADASLTLHWTDPPDLGTQSGMNAYVDRAGCPGTALLAGGPPPPGNRVFMLRPGLPVTMTQLDTAGLGWTSAHYGEQVALAITVLDSAGDESPLSNVICVTHAQIAADAGTDGRSSSVGCGCSAGRSRTSLGWLALVALLFSALLFSALRRRGRLRAWRSFIRVPSARATSASTSRPARSVPRRSI